MTRTDPLATLAAAAFPDLPLTSLAPLRPYVEVVRLGAGARLATAGTVARELAVVVRGEVRVGGRRCGPGTVVGAESVAAGQHGATVDALGSVELVVLPRRSSRWVALTQPVSSPNPGLPRAPHPSRTRGRRVGRPRRGSSPRSPRP